MNTLVAGFWGAYFGTAALMMVLSIAAFARAHRRVANMAAVSAGLSALYVIAFLGLLPVTGAVESRLLAHVAVFSSIGLAMMLLAMLGLTRQPGVTRRALLLLGVPGLAALGLGWADDALSALAWGAGYSFSVGAVMLGMTLRSAVRGDRQAWIAVTGVACMLVAVSGLCWIALDRDAPWTVHAASAVAGIAYLGVMATALWTRYSYLLELAAVMAHGPSYDPVTRMRSHSETGQMVGSVFFRREEGVRPVGLIAICVANLHALESLHGRAAFNHALFICASRLRRCVPPQVEMGRLGEDGFLLLLRNPSDLQRMHELARTLRRRLSRPVGLSTSGQAAALDAERTDWVAEVGIGLVAAHTEVRPSQAVAAARAMARTALSYSSRLAVSDPVTGHMTELPLDEEPPGR